MTSHRIEVPNRAGDERVVGATPRCPVIGLLALAIGGMSFVLDPAAAHAQSADLGGKTITIYIGYGAGGGFDYYGRLAARHLGRHIPGNPAVVVSNMPGAGSLRAANYLFNVAPKDGTALGVITPTVALEEVLGTKGVQYRAARFNWIGRMGPNIDVSMTWHASKVRTIEDAKRFPAAMAASGPGSTSEYLPKVLNTVVGTQFKVVVGYAGANEGMLAMERGEVDGAMTSWNTLSTSKQEWVRDRKVNVIVQYVSQRLKEMPNTPALAELGRTADDRQILELFASSATIGKAILAPPDVPADHVRMLRQAFAAMLTDPTFLADVEKNKTEYDPASGEELQRMVEAASGISAAARDLARKARGM